MNPLEHFLPGFMVRQRQVNFLPTVIVCVDNPIESIA